MRVLISFTVSLFTAIAYADHYTCNPELSESVIIVELNGENLSLVSPHDSAGSAGVYVGKEEAPYSSWYNYSLYELTDFFKTHGSSFMLALSPSLTRNENEGVAYYYFDNESHEEGVIKYSCVKTK